MRSVRWLFGIALSIAAVEAANAQGDWDVVLSGRSFHLNAARQWNEDNWGFGVEREFNPERRWVKLFLANAYKDSVDEPSYMAGGGLKRRFRVPSRDFYVDIGRRRVLDAQARCPRR